MTVIEKVAYLKGLAEGLGLDENNKTDKLISAIIDVLDDMALTLCDIEDDVADISDQVDAVDEDLADVEEFLYEDEDDDCDCDCDCDDEFFQVTCPECGEDIFVDDDMLEDEFINCPACGTKLEFDFDDCDCEDDDCDCGCCDH
ncbi:MAG: hypothetical protein IJF54_01280 [Clostridia bacterium]|nr:hypothetical protein [Clostridia bacterium]